MVRPRTSESSSNAAPVGGPIAVLSDIHSNWQALQAVLAECEERGVKRFYSLGDIVGYGANPSECLNAVRKLECPVVMGNHDEYVAFETLSPDLNPMARSGVEYSALVLRSDERTWLQERPYVIKDGVATLVHASLETPREWVYVLDAASANACLALQETPVCFNGHTHRPAIYCRKDLPVARETGSQRFQLPRDGRTLVNPGSVGQPRDGNPRAQFAIFDPDEMMVEMVRVPYDVTTAATAILKAGLPARLATRLLHGR